MVDDLVRDLMPNAINKKLHLRFYPPEKQMAHIVGDAQRLRQVMLNMIDNAIKYTEKGKIDARLAQKGEEIIFSVTDTGKGLAPDEISRLFNKFTRVGGATRYHTEGSGLGLYVAKQIVHEHHGDVVAESPGVGKGSTFSVKLPIEGSAKSLKVGEKATVIIKAADAQGKERTQ
jgi:signal transduction histidine kinase